MIGGNASPAPIFDYSALARPIGEAGEKRRSVSGLQIFRCCVGQTTGVSQSNAVRAPIFSELAQESQPSEMVVDNTT
ncbi:hypothetical protein CCGE525_38050 (plasmid) [Rhizobium jaguaris]|uniref:Uncharacterized protein n=1 Tax=Rhizobium jaguaris TaxID=1312183 RepID=A0A387G1V7_9HYPH|nr:hypothetical protein CCGE525_38050 [Rhizobium jaguaris]